MNLLSIVFAVAGAVAGGLFKDLFGSIVGAMFGYLLAEVMELKKRLAAWESNVKFERAPRERKTSHLQTSSVSPQPESAQADDMLFDPPQSDDFETDFGRSGPTYQPADHLETATDSSDPAVKKAHGNGYDFQKTAEDYFARYFSGGNLMVGVGVVVLFFGIAFLIKYAAERDMLPIELRLAACALFGMGLVAIGWRLREQRRGYALALQGGGIGILYLTIFGAAKLYNLVPLLMAFGIMLALVFCSTLIALLQDARALALLGTIGGFLAPILTSSGRGSHVALFSYYLLLNSGILSIAWFKAWRELNLTGFIFTFGIGAVWGINAYDSRFLATTLPFLILFFLIYFFLSILFALRQPVNLRGYVDSTLVFGLPLTAFGLLSGLVGSMEFGLAVSAVILAALYIFSATILWRLHTSNLRLLVEAFLALGVMFATLAVPLATNGHWTAGTWALEGGALFWLGIRQRRLLSRCAGLILHICAAVAVMTILVFATAKTVIAVSGGLVALSVLFISYLIQRHASELKPLEKSMAPVLLAWGVIWWLGAGLHDIDAMLTADRSDQAAVLFIAGTLLLFNRIGIALEWLQIRYLGLGLLPLMLILALHAFETRITGHPFHHGWWMVWLFNFVVFYDLIRKNRELWPEPVLKAYHLAGGLLSLFLLTWDLAYWTGVAVNSIETWPFTVWAAVPAISALILLTNAERLPWPVREYPRFYQHKVTALILLYLLLWSLRACFKNGNPHPLFYLPVLNPIDLATLFVLLLVLYWTHHFSDQLLLADWGPSKRSIAALTGIFGLIWLTAITARTLHFRANVPYTAAALFDSALVQASLSVVWSCYAMGVLFISTKRDFRQGWIAGAGLLAIIVGKLFLVDLSGSGTIARIVSFVAVGILMLIIGYFFPMPPNRRKDNNQ